MDVIQKYHVLAEKLKDDTWKVAYAIRTHHYKNIYFSAILNDIENASFDRLEKFEVTIDLLLSKEQDFLIRLTDNIYFSTVEMYIQYLQSLLDSNSIEYAEYKTKAE